ncbi:hypothetical protein N234_00075 [Ralstonia pickettii DTP0602]|nr:hypothetical protein N234_00075 [Ralstonia pickettii DTP0602]
MIRHPSYLGLAVSSLGWVLGFRSGVGVLLTLAMVPVLIARIRAEEALLLERFGDADPTQAVYGIVRYKARTYYCVVSNF